MRNPLRRALRQVSLRARYFRGAPPFDQGLQVWGTRLRPAVQTLDLIDQGVISIGRYSLVFCDFEVWRTPGDVLPLLEVGNFAGLGKGVQVFLNAEHHSEYVTTFPLTHVPLHEPFLQDITGEIHPKPSERTTVGHDTYICVRSSILGGVTIGDGAVVATRAVVTEDVEPFTIVAGVPAKPVRRRFDDATIERLLALNWWHWPDDRIRDAAPLLMAYPDEANLSALEAFADGA